MLELKDIVVTFGQTSVLRGLSCTVQPGDFIMVVGANGAGKSTLFDVIAGRIKPQAGSLLLAGKDISTLSQQERATFIARLFQKPALSTVGSLTVAENVALATYKNRRAGFAPGLESFPEQIVKERLVAMGIDIAPLLHRPMEKLSGGQQQLIAFVMATLVQPQLLLLDEPTAALDPASATKLLIFAAQYIKKYKIPTIMITHDPAMAIHLGNALWVLENGVIARTYGPEKRSLQAQDLVGGIDYHQLSLVQ